MKIIKKCDSCNKIIFFTNKKICKKCKKSLQKLIDVNPILLKLLQEYLDEQCNKYNNYTKYCACGDDVEYMNNTDKR
jgi:hypothetical protein